MMDVNLVDTLEQKLKYIQQVIYMAYMAKINYDDVLSQVRLWDNLIFNYLKRKKIVIPPRQKEINKTEKFRGAYVKELNIGVYKNVVCMDVTSLYPNIMRLINISPECLSDKKFDFILSELLQNPKQYTKELRDNNLILAGNGHTFNKDKRGFLPDIVSTIFNNRSLYKKKMIECKIELERIKHELNRRGLNND